MFPLDLLAFVVPLGAFAGGLWGGLAYGSTVYRRSQSRIWVGWLIISALLLGGMAIAPGWGWTSFAIVLLSVMIPLGLGLAFGYGAASYIEWRKKRD